MVTSSETIFQVLFHFPAKFCFQLGCASKYAGRFDKNRFGKTEVDSATLLPEKFQIYSSNWRQESFYLPLTGKKKKLSLLTFFSMQFSCISMQIEVQNLLFYS
jgi:hypothetical protein